MQCSIAWHGMPCFSVKGCAHGSRIAWLECLTSNHWLHHGGSIAWHMVPRSNQILHAMQHRVALDASLQNQWLRTWQQRCVARDASLRINGCTHGGSIAWHMAPSSNQLLHAMQHRLALDASRQNQRLRTWQQRCVVHDASLQVNGCTHGGSIAWHMVPS